MMLVRSVLVFLLTIEPGLPHHAHGCGLEPAFDDGLTVSYPGALVVAAAVAQARQSGVLPQADSAASDNEARLRKMLVDLQRLQLRLSQDAQYSKEAGASFSIVLVGPGLWSRHYLTSRGGAAEYHTAGPRTDEAVVITHHSVLQALLRDSLTASQAAETGLLSFSGSDFWLVQDAFQSSFRGGA